MAATTKFMLVLFVDDAGQKKSIDIVPANWMSYDEVQHHLVTPFIFNSSEANLRILKDYVQSGAEPLKSWDLYRITVRGSATSYAEAEKKMKDLAKESEDLNRGLSSESVLESQYVSVPKGRSEKLVSQAASKESEAEVDNRARKTGNFNIPTGALDVEDSDDMRAVNLKCYRGLSAQIDELQSQLADIKLHQSEMISVISQLNTKIIEKITDINSTIKKYNLGELPLKTLGQFKEFDTQLKSNESIRNEITNGIAALVKSDIKYLTKSTRDIIERFMIREVLLNFTAVRESGGKIIFKRDTTFYLCMRDAILSKRNTDITEQSIDNAIGAVIHNATSWDRRRQNRKNVKSRSVGGHKGGSKKA